MAEKQLSPAKAHIQMMYSVLSRSNRQIADYLLKPDCDISEMTINDFAQELGVSAATVVRFCRTLGYRGFAEMKVRLSDGDQNNDALFEPIAMKDTIGSIRQKVVALNKRTMDDLNKSLGEELLEAVSALLINADQIVIISEGGSSCAGYCAYDAFTKLALNCIHHTDPFFQLMAIRNLDPSKRCVVFAVNNSGRSMSTLESLKLAREMGIPTIGVVGLPNTPSSKYLDYELVTGMFDSDIYSDMTVSRIGEIGVISVLYSVIATKASREQVRRSRKIITSLDRKRV